MYNCDEEVVIKVVPIYHMIITSSTCSESSLIYKRVRKDSLDPQGTFEACTRPEAVTNNFSNDPNFSRDRAKTHTESCIVPTRYVTHGCLEQEE